MPMLGILIVNAANAVRSWAQLNVNRPSFNSLEPWLPVLHFGSSAGMETLWLGLMAIFSTVVTLTMVLALLSTAITFGVPALPRWRRFLLLWVAVVIAGVVTVGAAQLGEVLLTIELFGGRGGSWVRMFTVPALLEALRWGVLWGWIPALATALIATPQPARRRSDGSRRRRGFVAVGALTVAALLSGLWLVDSSRETMRRSMDASAAPAPTPTSPAAPTDPPALTAAEPAPDAAGRCPGSALSTTLRRCSTDSVRSRCPVSTCTRARATPERSLSTRGWGSPRCPPRRTPDGSGKISSISPRRPRAAYHLVGRIRRRFRTESVPIMLTNRGRLVLQERPIQRLGMQRPQSIGLPLGLRNEIAERSLG